jgi:hypothetical protein
MMRMSSSRMKHEDSGAGVVAADADVVESAVVPEGEFAVAVDAVFADAEVLADQDALPGWDGAGSGCPGGVGGASVDAAVWAGDGCSSRPPRTP